MITLTLLLAAASILAILAFVHSYLGEKYMLQRLFSLEYIPLFRKDRHYTERVLRLAWHITGVSWLGFATVLVLLAVGLSDLIANAIAIIFALHGIGILAVCGHRHPAWSLFLIASAAVWFAGLA